MTETFEIIPGTYEHVEDVQVKFITTTEKQDVQVYSERACLDTIASLEAQKVSFCESKDEEIEVNNQMLLKIRAINRPINVE